MDSVEFSLRLGKTALARLMEAVELHTSDTEERVGVLVSTITYMLGGAAAVLIQDEDQVDTVVSFILNDLVTKENIRDIALDIHRQSLKKEQH